MTFPLALSILALAAAQPAPAGAPPRAWQGFGADLPLEPPGHVGINASVSDDDYPDSARRNHEQGTVWFHYVITPEGRATHCTVTVSSGSTALDERTCRIAEERIRYRPARDAEGHPYAMRSREIAIVWRVPGE